MSNGDVITDDWAQFKSKAKITDGSTGASTRIGNKSFTFPNASEHYRNWDESSILAQVYVSCSTDTAELFMDLCELSDVVKVKPSPDCRGVILYVAADSAPDSDYACEYLNRALDEFSDDFRKGDIEILEAYDEFGEGDGFYVDDVAEDPDPIDQDLNVVEQATYRVPAYGEVGDESADITAEIETAINSVENPQVYNYDISVDDDEWRIRVWVLAVDVEGLEPGEGASFLDELEQYLPDDWVEGIDYVDDDEDYDEF